MRAPSILIPSEIACAKHDEMLVRAQTTNLAIKDIKYTPHTAHTKMDCGHLMAAASRDLNIYIYDVLQGYQVQFSSIKITMIWVT